ncbi:MAG TPA: phosphoribosylanthranilate isomerase [Vicinamibacterales bacterium]|nr:phosphoribosylanthranilate isomerase [Vicinamibacterales bacterium]
MIPVKICGITREEDAALAAELGASAVGLIFWPNSPRRVDRARARAIVRSLPPFVGAIGVFVNQVAEAADVAGEVGLTAVQFHGDEAADAYRGFPVRVIKSVPVRDAEARAAADAVPDEATVLLDAHDPVTRGGTGRPIDWTIAAAIARTRPVILSGGLNAANASAALEAVHPYAIDVSSGVESSPGRKDAAKLRELFAVLRTL